jgi:NAD(P)-dependent dehydrogenase (short-subunit alcohol dehydrogenase family)
MKEFAGRIAVVTGGGSGMGRELVRQLVAEACNVIGERFIECGRLVGRCIHRVLVNQPPVPLLQG